MWFEGRSADRTLTILSCGSEMKLELRYSTLSQHQYRGIVRVTIFAARSMVHGLVATQELTATAQALTARSDDGHDNYAARSVHASSASWRRTFSFSERTYSEYMGLETRLA